MLIFQDQQLRRLSVELQSRRIEPFVDHAKQFHGPRSDQLGDEALSLLVRKAVVTATHYGLESSRDICRFLDLVMTFGLNWEAEDLRWMHERMVDEAIADPPARLGRLRREVLYRLETAGTSSGAARGEGL